MAGITSCMVNSFRQEILVATHNFTATTGNVFKVPLFKAQASLTGTYDKTTTNYSSMTGNSDELANGNGYTTGGFAWTAAQNTTPSVTNSVAIATWSTNPSWTSSTFVTRGCMIYNSSASNKCVSLYNFGSDQTVTAGTLTLVLPTANDTSAILRLA